MDAFARGAQYYDAFANPPGRLERETPLLRHCLERAPGKRVLDMACGTGVHAVRMAELGAQVTAADVSEEMVAYARAARPHPRVEYVAMDMRAITGGPWDLALCLGNSLTLLPEPEDHRRVFERVHAALAPNGLFLLQVVNYETPQALEARHRVTRKQVGDVPVTAIKSLVPDAERTFLTLNFFADEADGIHQVGESAVLRHLSAETLQQSAAAAGFTVAERFGSYEQAPYDAAASPDILMLLQKGG